MPKNKTPVRSPVKTDLTVQELEAASEAWMKADEEARELDAPFSDEDLERMAERHAQDEMDRKMNEGYERSRNSKGGSMLMPPERQKYSMAGKVTKLIVEAAKKSKSVQKGKAPKREEIQAAIDDVKTNNAGRLEEILKNNKPEQRALSRFENYASGGGGTGNLDAVITSVLKPATENQNAADYMRRSQKGARKDKVIDTGKGILIGGISVSAGYEGLNAYQDMPTEEKSKFESAFSAAHNAGEETFELDGKTYTTEVKKGKMSGGMMKYNEGGSMLVPPEMEEDMPVDTYDNIPEDEMAAAEASQLPDDEMEDGYLEFVLNESLETDDQEYLMSVLETDERLSSIFDKVMDVAGEFSGEGEVDGPGTGVSDSIPARLSDGEFVFTKKATDQMGADQLQTMMDEAEKAYDGGLMKKAFGGMVDDIPMDERQEDEEINNMMITSNQMPSVKQR